MLVNCKRAYDGVFVATNRLWSLDLRESSVEQVTNTYSYTERKKLKQRFDRDN